MTTENATEILRVNAVYWREVPHLLQSGYRPQFVSMMGYLKETLFACTLQKPGSNERLVVISSKAQMVEPDLIEPVSALLEVVTHSDEDALVLPLVEGATQDTEKTAILRFTPPRPDLKWILEVDGEVLNGERAPLAITRIDRVLENAVKLGATRAEIPIPPSLRQHFRARDFRISSLEKAIAPKKIQRWAADSNLNVNALGKVVNRGDNIPELRRKVARVTGLPSKELWPEIDWGT